MYRLSSIIILLGLYSSLLGQSPHGESFRVNCADCHTADSWDIPAEHWTFREASLVKPEVTVLPETEAEQAKAFFTHEDTDFPLEGGHRTIDCRFCHETLVFSEASTSCVSCHTDIHHMTVGDDCARCHTSDNWLVDNITELHQENGLPLLGMHAQISCNDCHESESGLQFTRIGNDCINCHREDYLATTSPNHAAAGYSLDCIECHDVNAMSWGASILHDFFPLVKGHDIADCNACHTNGVFENTPTDCFSCHQDDYNQAANPNHVALNFGIDCKQCHTLDVNWMPATFDHDGMYFPIYSGNHKDAWNDCADCHIGGNLNSFSCIDCHEHNDPNDLADEHNDVSGYIYASPECLRCHPNGD